MYHYACSFYALQEPRKEAPEHFLFHWKTVKFHWNSRVIFVGAVTQVQEQDIFFFFCGLLTWIKPMSERHLGQWIFIYDALPINRWSNCIKVKAHCMRFSILYIIFDVKICRFYKFVFINDMDFNIYNVWHVYNR